MRAVLTNTHTKANDTKGKSALAMARVFIGYLPNLKSAPVVFGRLKLLTMLFALKQNEILRTLIIQLFSPGASILVVFSGVSHIRISNLASLGLVWSDTLAHKTSPKKQKS